jgi:hypothetical protein
MDPPWQADRFPLLDMASLSDTGVLYLVPQLYLLQREHVDRLLRSESCLTITEKRNVS